MTDKIAQIGDTVYWSTMTETRAGKVVKVTVKTAQVHFPKEPYMEECTVSVKRNFPIFGQLKGRFNQFKLG